jgi:TonB family protein
MAGTLASFAVNRHFREDDEDLSCSGAGSVATLIALPEPVGSTPATLLKAAPEERLDRPTPAPPSRFWALLAAVLLLHAVPVAILVALDLVAPPIAAPEQEIAVEVVAEPPPGQTPPPPEQQKEQQERAQEKAQPEPPKQKLTLDEKPAFDAPRAENKEQLKREAQDEETKALRLARPDEHTAQDPDPQRKQPQQESQPEPSPEQGATTAQEEERREADVLEQAAPRPAPNPQKKFGARDPKAARGEARKSIADMVASLEPAPEFKLGGSAKTAPISGGSANPTYLSVVYGYILRQYHPPGDAHPNQGIISFYVDPSGHLIHQALRRSCGSSARDQAALSALRRAAPFPPTPNGSAVGLVWEY